MMLKFVLLLVTWHVVSSNPGHGMANRQMPKISFNDFLKEIDKLIKDLLDMLGFEKEPTKHTTTDKPFTTTLHMAKSTAGESTAQKATTSADTEDARTSTSSPNFTTAESTDKESSTVADQDISTVKENKTTTSKSPITSSEPDADVATTSVSPDTTSEPQVTSTEPEPAIPTLPCNLTCATSLLTEWTQAIFKDIRRMPKLYNPRRMISFGERSFPILRGNTILDNIMVAAGLGRGKVVAIQSVDYFEDFQEGSSDNILGKFHRNLKLWLTNGTFTSNDEICWLETEGAMDCLSDPSKTILVSFGHTWPTEVHTDEVIRWVRRGGGFIHAFDYDWWSSETSEGKMGRSLLAVGFYRLLLEAGIGYHSGRFYRSFTVDVYTNADWISTLVHGNLKHAVESVNERTFMKNEVIEYVLEELDGGGQFYPRVVHNYVLAPLVPFAVESEQYVEFPNRNSRVRQGDLEISLFKLYYMIGMAGLWKKKAPHVDRFPGDIDPAPPLETYEIECQGDYQEAWCPTGAYLLPGQELKIEVLSLSDKSWTSFQVLIGTHTDRLYKLDKLRRFPEITMQENIMDPEITLSNPFGGLVSIVTPSQFGAYIKVRLSGVIPTPYFNLADPVSIANWNTSRYAPGLWAEIIGRNMRFTIGSHSAAQVDHPGHFLEVWDSVLESNYDLLGTPVEDRRKQWLSSDLEISVGVMHSGYPIAARLDKGSFNDDQFVLKDNWDLQWGIYHEFGHNMPIRLFTWSEVMEVGNNVFAMLQMERLTGEYEKSPNSRFASWVKNPNYRKLKPGVHFGLYYQLRKTFGWGCYHKVYKTYLQKETELPNIPSIIRKPPVNSRQVFDQWPVRWSVIAGYNLLPLFDFWDYPIYSYVKRDINNLQLPPFLPLDDHTLHPNAVNHTASIILKYPDIQHEVTVKPDCPEFDINPRVDLWSGHHGDGEDYYGQEY